ncbi:MAG: cation-translocating P-type ATPase [Chloroflexi bacterium]|nr:cation-translocating P-type ATPase [Chloroflexota bacterium]
MSPDVLKIAKRIMRVVKTNLLFTTTYNIVGLPLAVFGILPPVLAVATQSLPDIGIMGNSARLLKQKPSVNRRLLSTSILLPPARLPRWRSHCLFSY